MEKRKRQHRLGKIISLIAIAICIVIGMIAGTIWFYSDTLPPTSELRNFTMRSGSEVYDRSGKMIYLFAFEKRKLVSLKELPDYLVDALLVTEDKNFYKHHGIDILGNIRALAIDIVRMDFSQGASTITQQMARNMFLTLDKRISRKMKEIILAFRIEREFSKDEILEIYFNKIFWGGQLHGIEAAALNYYGKHASDLTLAESAALIGMIQRPNYYNPIKHPERTEARRNRVLGRMLQARKISQEEHDLAISAPLRRQGSSMRQTASDYFIEHIRLYLERKYGTDRLFEGGLRIYTTLDQDLTVYADSVLNDYLTQIENRYNYSNKFADISANAYDVNTRYLQGGLVLMENDTGYVRAMIGGRDFAHSKFNRMTQARRQPGSAIKPVYYTAAIEKGYTPATVIKDERISLIAGNGKLWTPSNYSKKFYGFTRMRTALTHSYNIWAVKTAIDLGFDTMTDAFNRFGINRKVTDYSAALGTYEVTPITLISAYTTFPNQGTRVSPVFIQRVEDLDGRVLERGIANKSTVTSAEVSYLMTSMMQSVTTSGTGAGARKNYHWQVAGKTGTSSDHRDAWFIGFNPKFTLGIWNGFDSNANISSSAACTPIWGQIMTHCIRLDNRGKLPSSDHPSYVFERPDDIVTRTINPKTGFVTKQGGIEEYFIKDNIPPVMADTLQFNFYPTRWGFNDELELN
ncbi:MAG: PBP1A family penicillin-binding protein [Candidatus Cloacimonadaceae bacterium]|jgi:penicillin-binding protein 1A|nr:PBP1A family penicillin-binding protein [Candidatus Cloacimonadota bacterium]MDY0127088.1 PBP1A family penicillin-binding protein [Candidatus Cloacimonadaceae bacterium]MCB5255697.1 PBP1A family penicillin-binding protein [Candidatus Cloacimonadota bacterium]MCK9177771.1 PBP1A family penicillin-binding protein [Candidatus Cloacimonadota bacterium]MCK9241755.1 PBP1A family penicillin-binding protein [Candidatus Cloacimonadota bacterium]